MTEIEKVKLVKQRGVTYNPESGDVIGVGGLPVKSKHRNGYLVVSVRSNGKSYYLLAHRVAWFLYYGELPKNFIDHVDGNKTNNKIENLRDVTHLQNIHNIHGFKGYSWNEKLKKYGANITVNGKKYRLGHYKTEQEAHEAYLKGKQKYHLK